MQTSPNVQRNYSDSPYVGDADQYLDICSLLKQKEEENTNKY